MKQKYLGLILFLGAVSAQQGVSAQETNYHSVSFSYSFPPSLKVEGDAPKTFDLKILLAGDDPVDAAFATDESKALRKELTENNYKINFSGLQQVDSTSIGDLHIITVLQLMQNKTGFSGSGGIMTTNIAVFTAVTNGEGIQIYSKQLHNETLSTTYGAALTRAQVNELVVENAVAKSLEDFQNAMTGYSATVNTKLADLDDVKKLPELKAFEAQVKELKEALSKNGIEAFCTSAEKYVPFWQQQADNHLEKNGDEVKRAAYQNLSLYYILKGNTDKARETIEAYKSVDKIVKELMGLLKYKNSEDLEKLIAALDPEKKILSVSTADKKVTLNEAVTRFLYLKIDGTVTIEDKKNGGTYSGKIFVKKPDHSLEKNSGIVNLGAVDFDMAIKYNDNGAEKQIQTRLSKVKSLKDNGSSNYTVIKAGTNMLGDMSSVSIASDSYILMKETYVSPKIALYRILLPQPEGSESSMLIRKAGDPKGVRTKLLNFRKNLTDYLADCTATTDMIKQSKNINGDINKILETYTSCN